MKKTHLALIAFVNLIFYLPIIISSLKFYDDDFIIFAYITSNPSSPIITDPSAQYFLFLRPLSYFSFWIDYTLFSNNYIAIKLVSLTFHIIFIMVVYFLLNRISKKFNLFTDTKIILLLCLILSIHLDSLLWIIFINNRTEQLMILFYSLSLLYFIKYTDAFYKKYIVLSFLYFLLSLLSKQTGLHLPLIFLVFILYEYYSNKAAYLRNKELVYFLIISIVVILLAAILNLYFYKDQLGISENLWKKPFTIFSIIIHTLIPLYSNYIHNFFIINKIYATILFIFACSIIILSILLLKKRYQISNTKILLALALFILIFIPRVFAIGSQRLNGIILLWLCISLLLVGKFISNSKLIYSSLLIVFLLGTIMFYIRANQIIACNNYKEEKFINLIHYQDTRSGNTLIICYDTYDILPYKYEYYVQSKFGKTNKLISIPIMYELVLVNYDLSFYKKVFINCERNGNEFTLTSDDPLIYLLIYKNDSSINLVNIKETVISDSGRGYKKIVFSLSKDLLNGVDNFVYFNGLNWIELK